MKGFLSLFIAELSLDGRLAYCRRASVRARVVVVSIMQATNKESGIRTHESSRGIKGRDGVQETETDHQERGQRGRQEEEASSKRGKGNVCILSQQVSHRSGC